MPFKKAEVRYVTDSKYGPRHRGVFALEKLSKGEELVYICDELNERSPYYSASDKRGKYTKSELLQLFKDHPRVESICTRLAYMVDGDLYNVPLKYANEKFDNIDECEERLVPRLFINHSCDANLIRPDKTFYARRDIEIGEELTMDYICFDGGLFFDDNGVCQCGSIKCHKTGLDQLYKNPQWIQENEQYCRPYMKKKIEQVRQANKQQP